MATSACSSLVEMAVSELMVPRDLANQAWATAIRAQRRAENAMRDLGRRALDRAVAEGKPAIILAGHSYNAFTPEAPNRSARNYQAWAFR